MKSRLFIIPVFLLLLAGVSFASTVVEITSVTILGPTFPPSISSASSPRLNSAGDPVPSPILGWKKVRIDVRSAGPLFEPEYNVYRDGNCIGSATLDTYTSSYDAVMGRWNYTGYFHCTDTPVQIGYTYTYTVEHGCNSVSIYID